MSLGPRELGLTAADSLSSHEQSARETQGPPLVHHGEAGTHPDGLQEVQVGQEVALCLVEPLGGGRAEDLLGLQRYHLVRDRYKVLQGGGIAHVSEVDVKAFDQHLEKSK